MTSSRSLFTEAIEDHLALKKTNSGLEPTMPLMRFDVGDPLDRYPGGPVRPATGEAVQTVAVGDATANGATSATPALGGPVSDHTQAFAMPTAGADEVALGRPVEPLSGLTPMLSLVEDLDDEDDLIAPSSMLGSSDFSTPAMSGEAASAPVLRFPGGVGPRDGADLGLTGAFDAAEQTQLSPAVSAGAIEAPVVPTARDYADDAQQTGEQPVIVIDADEPLASIDVEPRRTPQPRRKGGSFFGLRRKKKNEPDGEGWFAGQPRGFTWND